MILSALILIPLIGSIVVGFFPGPLSAQRTRLGAIIFSTVSLGLTVLLATRFDLMQGGLQMQEFVPWLPDLGLNYSLAVDGLSLPLIALTNFLTLLLAFNSNVGLKPGEELKRSRLF